MNSAIIVSSPKGENPRVKNESKTGHKRTKVPFGFSCFWTNLGASRRSKSSFGAWGDSPGTGLKATRMENGNS